MELFYRPSRVLWVCLGLTFSILVFDGSLLRLWGLHRNFDRIEANIVELKGKSSALEEKLRLANRPEFVEKQARDRLDLVGKDELVFIFSE